MGTVLKQIFKNRSFSISVFAFFRQNKLINVQLMISIFKTSPSLKTEKLKKNKFPKL